MNILKTLVITSILTLGLTLVGQAQASGSNCTGYYGGGYGNYSSSQSCAKITIDKKVLKPGTKDFVDNLSVYDPKYGIDQNVTFQIVVQNVGDEDLTNLTVDDTFPQNLTFVSGPGSFDKATNKLTFNIGPLKSGESQTFYVSAKVSSDITFNNDGMVCSTNYVHVEKKDKVSADDSAQFCAERTNKVYPPVLGIKQTPPTGPEAMALPILMGMGSAGIFLRRKSK